MARTLNKLNPSQVKAAQAGDRLSDGGGLYLRVNPDGAARWLLRYSSPTRAVPDKNRPGKTLAVVREMGLGAARGAQALTLAQARERASVIRRQLVDGLDPLDAREDAKDALARENEALAEAARALAHRPTFGQVASDYIATHRESWRNAKHAGQWVSTLANDAAALTNRPVEEITAEDVVAVLKPLWLAKPETASRLRCRIEQVLTLAIARKQRPEPNPALWRSIKPMLPKQPKKDDRVKHHRALAWKDVPAFVTALRTRQHEATAALAFEFLVLTAARTGEVLGAAWREIEMDAEGGPRWRIPAARMKAGREHIVPLSPAAQRVLAKARYRVDPSPDAPIFPSPRRPTAPLSNMALLVLLDRMKWRDRTTAHGLRSAFRVWCAEATSFPREIAEAALAHVNKDKTEAAYLHTDHLQKRRKLMDAWAGHIERAQPVAGRAA